MSSQAHLLAACLALGIDLSADEWALKHFIETARAPIDLLLRLDPAVHAELRAYTQTRYRAIRLPRPKDRG